MISIVVDLSIIFGPVIGFVSQYREISALRSSEGFSNLVCFVLLTCNVLRVFFWIGKLFDPVLLVQSLVMILTQFVLLGNTCRYPSAEHVGKRFYVFDKWKFGEFWKWEDLRSYLKFLGIFSFTVGITTIAWLQSDMYIEFLGFLSLMIEASLGIPQMKKNFDSGSTTGLSMTMILMWTFGDTFKSVYYIIRQSPFQFLLCGIIQLAVDFVILVQFYYYGEGED